jgi:dienelactone hydrolase
VSLVRRPAPPMLCDVVPGSRNSLRTGLLAVVAVFALLATLAAVAPRAGAGPAVSVQTLQVTLVDHSRPTDATTSAPAQKQRVLATTITYPLGGNIPMPLVVLAHGDNGHPSKFTQLIGAWAAAGYVVAAPAFPLTNNTTPGGSSTGDVANQPADVSFVIDKVLKMSRPRVNSPLAGLVDKRHIGVAGLSLGGSTVYGLVFNTCCRDKRIDAAILMSAMRVPFKGGKNVGRHVPALLVHSDADPKWYPVSARTYPLLATPKWFVTLHGSTHSGPFEDTPDPADVAVPPITVAFWDRYLKGDRSAQTRLINAVSTYGQAELQHALPRVAGRAPPVRPTS